MTSKIIRCTIFLYIIYIIIIPTPALTNTSAFIAFNYHTPSTKDLAFLSKFKYVVTLEFWDQNTVSLLKKRGVKLIHYEWLPAMYVCSNRSSWEEKVIKNSKNWIIDNSPTDPDPMGAKYGCKDYFFTFTNDFIEERTKEIKNKLLKNNYDGVFFDWAVGSKIFEHNKYKFLANKLEKNFPYINYDKQIEKFLKSLKRSGIFIILNRGFRNKKATFDKWADVDIAESVFTTVINGSTVIESPEKAISIAENFIKAAKRSNSSIRFLFLNYALPYHVGTPNCCEKVDEQAILYAISISLLTNSFSFTASKDVSLKGVKSNIYFIDLGKPIGKYKVITHKGRKVWIREFSKGVVIVGYHGTSVSIDSHGHKQAYDMLEKLVIKAENEKFHIKLLSHPYKETFQPVGKILLWKENRNDIN